MSGWTPITASGGRMTVTPADPNRIYVVLLGVSPAIVAPYIYRSDDAGATWVLKITGVPNSLGGSTTLPGNGQGFYDLDILASPNNADQLLVATTSAYKSIDGGATYVRFAGYGGSFNIHSDMQEIIALGNDTWIATDGGISYSSDFFTSAANCSVRSKGIHGSDFWGFAQGWNEDIVGGGRYHNGNAVMNETYPFGRALFMKGTEAPTGYYMIGRPRYVAFSDATNQAIPPTFNGGTKSFAFTKYPNEDGYGSDPSEVEFSPSCYMHVYLGKDNQFWKSTDGGATWTSLYTFSNKVKKFEISRSNPNVIYLAATNAFYKSVDGGTTWATIALPSGASASRMEIGVDFTNENNVWITSPSNSSGNRVFKSTNGGTSWTNLTTPAINGRSYVNLVHQAGTDGGVYILADNAYVYYRNNKMPDWVSYAASLPKSSPLLSKPFYRDGKLRTAGNRGIWEVDFYEASSPVAQPMVDKLAGNSCKADTFYFDSYSVLSLTGASFSWSFPGASYVSSTTVRNPKVVYTPGTHSVTLTVSNPNGTSTKILGSTITVAAGANTPAAPTITQSGFVLTSSSTTGNQWCLNGTPIPGATNQNYTATVIGNYSVVFIKGGCASVASNVINVNTVGMNELDNPNQLSVYPNPSSGEVNVGFNADNKTTYSVEITNAIGEVVYKEEVKDFKGGYTKSLHIGKGVSGIYTLRLSNTQNQTVKKIIVY
jgi:PKD repeat protein